MRKFLPFFIFILVLSSFAYAQPPFQTGSSLTSGLDIVTTPYDYVKQNRDFEANFHVFNKSNGIPMDNKSVDCWLDLYNHSGDEIFGEQITSYSGFDFSIKIGAGNFSYLGQYAWIVQCNTSYNGGFLNSLYQVTPDGKAPEETYEATGSIAITIFIMIIILGLFIIPFKTRFARSDILNDALKRCCWILALWLLSLSTAMVATIADNAGIELLSELFLFMFLINWGAYLFMFYVFFSFFLRVVQEMRDRSKNKRTGINE